MSDTREQRTTVPRGSAFVRGSLPAMGSPVQHTYGSMRYTKGIITFEVYSATTLVS